ncbi:MAG: 30S ribosomal protein S3 [Eubacteriales bacterium]
MGQKVNPHGLRVGVIRNWDSRWFARDDKFGDILVQDDKIRKFIKARTYAAGVSKIEIERDFNGRIKIFIHCAKVGIIAGRQGAEIEKLRQDVEKLVGQRVYISIVEIKRPDLNAQLVAERIASDLERRITFRRATRQAIDRTMKAGAKGIKTMVSGRLGGAEIARREHYHEGTIPLQTLRADIDYGFAEAHTTYGKIGVKVWIYKGEVLAANKKVTEKKEGERHVNAKKSKI